MKLVGSTSCRFYLLLVWIGLSCCLVSCWQRLDGSINAERKRIQNGVVRGYQYTVPISEIEALYDLYILNEGENWTWHNDTNNLGVAWDFSQYLASNGTIIPHVCQSNNISQHWQGVYCTSNCSFTPCQVTTLSLPKYGLNGILPSSIVNLTSLRVLDLSENHMFGSLPNDIGLFGSNLQSLSLSSNILTGTLPSSFYALTSLRQWQIDHNIFTGSLSNEIGERFSTSLEILNIENNYFSGTLPTTFSLLSKLQQFIISSNQFYQSTYPDFSNMTTPNLTVFDASDIGFISGTIPSSYYTLSELQVFTVGSGGLSGSLPSELGYYWPKMRVLKFYNTGLTGSLPETIGMMSNMEKLMMSSNPMTGSLPQSILELKKLSILQLTNSHFSGSFPSMTSTTTSTTSDGSTNLQAFFPLLVELMVGSNLFTGPLPAFSVSSSSSTFLSTYSISYNSFTGSCSLANFNGTSSLTYIDITGNQLSSSLPQDLVIQWKEMQYLYLYFNQLTGSLPNAVFHNLTNLFDLGLTVNLFSGNFPNPTPLYNMPLFRLFQAANNAFSGAVPEGFCGLPSLDGITFGFNHLQGSIPSCYFESIPQIATLDLMGNQLTSTIPLPTLQGLSTLFQLTLAFNQLTGTIPNGFETLPYFEYIDVSHNLLTGTIPKSILELGLNTQFSDETSIQIILSFNLFTGNIPFQYTQPSTPSQIQQSEFTSLVFYTDNNELEGDLSLLFSNISSRISLLDLSYNRFTGQIILPSTGPKMDLISLDFSSNFMIGSFPSNLSTIDSIGALIVANNLFSGYLPDSFGSLIHLVQLNVSNNILSGSLPHAFHEMVFMNFLDLSYNAFTGDLIGRFNNSQYLEELFVQNNAFSGKIDALLSPFQTTLQSVDFSSNRFTGPLPADLFTNSRLNLLSFAAVKNCLTGSIPDEICSAQILKSLALDGLHSASECNTPIYQALSNTAFGNLVSQSSYLLKSAITGSIPTCLFSMPHLTLLHLSGNGLSDELTDMSMVTEGLTDISFSHNALRGDIPLSLQDHEWQNMDFSFNFLTGELSSQLDENANNSFSLSLSVNRLSGDIPLAIQSLHDIDVLKGNLFSCEYNSYGDNEGLPSHDQAADSYGCGSNAVNAALYVFLGLCILLILVCMLWSLCVFRYGRSESSRDDSAGSDGLCMRMFTFIQKWLWETWERAHNRAIVRKQTLCEIDTILSTNGERVIACFVHLNESLRQFAGLCTLSIVIVFMCTYTALSQSYSTYSHKYSYQLGFMFLSGLTPAIVLLVMLTVFYALVKWQLIDRLKVDVYQVDKKKTSLWSPLVSKDTTWTSIFSMAYISCLRWCLWSIYWFIPAVSLFILNAVVTLTVNTAYVYSETLDTLSDSSLLGIALSVSLFKVMWNNVLILTFMPQYLHYFKRVTLTKLYEEELKRVNDNSKQIVTIQLSKDINSGSNNKIVNDESLVKSLLHESHLVSSEYQSEKSTSINMQEKAITNQHTLSICEEKDAEIAHRYDRQILLILLSISIFTNVLAPYISSFFFNPNCFYYTVSTIPAVTSSYNYFQCTRYQVVLGKASCSNYVTLSRSTTFTPPFIYNYQCSSSLIQSFTAVYVYRYVLSGILWPGFLILSHKLHGTLREKKNENERKSETTRKGLSVLAILSNGLYWFLNTVLPLAWKLHVDHTTEHGVHQTNRQTINNADSQQYTACDKSTESIVENTGPVHTPMAFHSTVNPSPNMPPSNRGSLAVSPTDRPFRGLHRLLMQLFSRETYILRLSGEFSVLLTFGIVFPPLAFVICIAIVTQTLTCEMTIARLLTLSKENDQSLKRSIPLGERESISASESQIPVTLSQYKMLLMAFPNHFHHECRQLTEFISLVIPYVSLLMMIFLSFSLFDTTADSTGDALGFVIMACLISVPVLENIIMMIF